jgi:hypothetical protein
MVEKNVLWLEVTIYDVQGVQMVQCKCDLGCVKLGHGIREALPERCQNI